MRRRLLPALMLAFLAACGGPPDGPPGEGEGDAAPGPERRVLVETAPAGPGSVSLHLVTTGVLESEAQADVVPEASGIVTQVLVEEGDPVRQGQELAVVSSPSLDANASRADIELDRLRREARQAEQLHAQGALSDGDRDKAQAALRVAETTWDEANRSRGFTRVTSPIAGTVAIRDVRVGDMAGGKRVFQVVDLSRLRVVVHLPEKDLAKVSVGQVAALAGAYDETAAARGEIERISPVVDPDTGTVRVTVRVTDAGTGSARVRPGQFVKVRLEVDRHDGVLTIPRRALVWIDGEPIAWRVTDAPPPEKEEEVAEGEDDEPGFFARLFSSDAKAEGDEGEEPEKDPWDGIPRRAVQRVRLEVGYSDPERVEVLSGLVDGDPVVVIGNQNLREDSLVRFSADPSPPEDEDEDEDEKGKKKPKKGRGKGGRH